MKKIAMLFYVLIVYSAMALISGCGGGGSGSSPPAQPTTAVVKLSTSGTLASGTLIGGIDITLVLPAGVTVKSTTPPQTDAGVVIPSGVAGGSLSPIDVYSAATSTLPGNVRVVLLSVAGFGTGEFATVNCDIAAGNFPTASGFSLVNFSVISATGPDISGLTPAFTADIR